VSDFAHWSGDDERDLSKAPKGIEQTFRQSFAYFKRKGIQSAREYLDLYRGKARFAALVEEADQALENDLRVLIRLDVESGEEMPVRK
jgi:hypothetical protein